MDWKWDLLPVKTFGQLVGYFVQAELYTSPFRCLSPSNPPIHTTATLIILCFLLQCAICLPQTDCHYKMSLCSQKTALPLCWKPQIFNLTQKWKTQKCLLPDRESRPSEMITSRLHTSEMTLFCIDLSQWLYLHHGWTGTCLSAETLRLFQQLQLRALWLINSPHLPVSNPHNAEAGLTWRRVPAQR